MRKPRQKTGGFRRVSIAMLVATALLPIVYALVGLKLSGYEAQTTGQAAAIMLYRMPVAEVILLGADVILLQKASDRRLRRSTMRLAVSAAVLIVYVLVHTARWFLG